MDNFGKPNFYGTYAGENTGEDIVQRPHDASSNTFSIVSNVDLQIKAEKKRKADKAYRERCKRQKGEMIEQLVSLGKENEDLKTENQRLKERNVVLNQSLQSQTGELNDIKHHLHNVKDENEKQNTLIQILTDHLGNPDLYLQNKKLRDENVRLREIVKGSDGALKLIEENGRLHHEKLLLEVKIDALLGQIVYGNSKNCEHK